MLEARPILAIGGILLVIVAALAVVSFGFPYGMTIDETPLAAYVTTALVAGGVWALLPRFIKRSDQRGISVLAVVLIGLAMRGAMFLSLPVLEDDSYRYLWDGAVTANGHDPYEFAPAEASVSTILGVDPVEPTDPQLAALRDLAETHSEPHSRINYPYVATIYPPLAQAAFAAAYMIDPFGLGGWRLVLLIADLISLCLLFKLLRAHDRSSVWASLYWWNPVVVLQGFGAGHMDVLLLPFVLAALLFAHHGKLALSSIALAGAVAVKLWPILLFPLFIRPLLSQPIKLVVGSALFAGGVIIALLPQLLHVLNPEAGLNAYASEWRTHAFVFAVLEDFVFAAFEEPGRMARIVVAGILTAMTGWLALRFAGDPERLPILVAVTIASLIFLSPTGYPWYLIWIAPLLAFVPHPGLLSVSALAPLYWLRFPLGDEAMLYQWGVVPLAFGVPLIFFFLPMLKRGRDDAIRDHHPSFE